MYTPSHKNHVGYDKDGNTLMKAENKKITNDECIPRITFCSKSRVSATHNERRMHQSPTRRVMRPAGAFAGQAVVG
jgi:hypothetical protein